MALVALGREGRLGRGALGGDGNARFGESYCGKPRLAANENDAIKEWVRSFARFSLIESALSRGGGRDVGRRIVEKKRTNSKKGRVRRSVSVESSDDISNGRS